MIYSPNIFLVFGNPGSGKDILIKAVNDLGAGQAIVISKHTNRKREDDDGTEMVCINDPEYDLDNCDITYINYGNMYGIKSKDIWNGLEKGVFQVIVVSNFEAIKQIKSIFSKIVKIIYIHSEMHPNEYEENELKLGKDLEYIKNRVEKFEQSFNDYLNNFEIFNHVLIYTGSDEDLFDQIFRLFRSYERHLIR